MPEKDFKPQTTEAMNLQEAIEFASSIEEELGTPLPLRLKLAISLLSYNGVMDFLRAYEKATILLSKLLPATDQSSETAPGGKSAE